MTLWTIEQSHLVDHPEIVGPTTTEEVIRWVRWKAAQPRKRPGQRPFGPLEVTITENGRLLRFHFRDKNGNRQRFMRLRSN